MVESCILSYLLLSLISVTQAHISDDNFRNFCMGSFLDLPDGLPPEQRVGDEMCMQLVPATLDSPHSRQLECSYAAPYDVAFTEDVLFPTHKTKCYWKQKTQCKPGELYLYGDCLRKTPVGTFAEVNKSCEGSSLYTTRTYHGNKLLTKYADNKNVWVNYDPQRSNNLIPYNKSIGYSEGQYNYGANYGHFSIAAKDFDHHVYAGYLVPTNDQERLVGFCSQNTYLEDNALTQKYCISTQYETFADTTDNINDVLQCAINRGFGYRKCFRLTEPGTYEEVKKNCKDRLFFVHNQNVVFYINSLFGRQPKKLWISSYGEHLKSVFPYVKELAPNHSYVVDAVWRPYSEVPVEFELIDQVDVNERHRGLCEEEIIDC